MSALIWSMPASQFRLAQMQFHIQNLEFNFSRQNKSVAWPMTTWLAFPSKMNMAPTNRRPSRPRSGRRTAISRYWNALIRILLLLQIASLSDLEPIFQIISTGRWWPLPRKIRRSISHVPG